MHVSGSGSVVVTSSVCTTFSEPGVAFTTVIVLNIVCLSRDQTCVLLQQCVVCCTELCSGSMSSPPSCCPGLQARAESGGEVDESLAVPLLEENRPPVLPGRENDELADVELRPESVSALVLDATDDNR